MPALALSGIPLPVLSDKGLTYTPTLLGESRRAFSGWLRSSERREVYSYAGNTGPLTQEDARAYRGLLKGEGDVWSFDADLRSSAFLAPSATSGTLEAGVPGGRYGGCLRMAVNASLTLPTALGTKWTVAYWWRLEGGGDWRHYVHRAGHFISDNGQLNVRTPNSGALAVATASQLPGGAVQLRNLGGFSGGISNPSNAALLVDDLVVLPWVAPAAWVAPWFAAGQPFGAPYPYHVASGDALYEPRTVLGRVGQGRAVEWWEGTSRVLGQEFDFELQER
ncbi:hypothetical protein [Comamonas sp. JC664]|uniref:hypothetical protein n=1 Tax=Comamonas sp. JC664 TaxID=2801917 RepID=UPI0017482E8F|nr:hypothetical protein [Comamonas sp. JC664]MBL0692945.1 hypothetical protein [Comamonas sp. JC664]GHG91359.1 hypothetical protein GCM10012319_52130 [Comamonas sp. KCTC 72670]